MPFNTKTAIERHSKPNSICHLIFIDSISNNVSVCIGVFIRISAHSICDTVKLIAISNTKSRNQIEMKIISSKHKV